MNYLEENNKLIISTLAQLEVMFMLGMGEDNKNCRKKQEDFKSPTLHGACIP